MACDCCIVDTDEFAFDTIVDLHVEFDSLSLPRSYWMEHVEAMSDDERREFVGNLAKVSRSKA